jgi:hypothetical protein
MDISRLSENEKLAAYGAVAVLIGGLGAVFTYATYSGTWLGIIAALAMLAVLFMPQLSAGTRLPGSKGSLMLVAGGIAGVVLVILFLVNIGFVFTQFGIPDIFFLVAVVGAVVMAFAGWREFQSEGGTFQFGSATPAAVGSTNEAVVTEPAPAPIERDETVTPREDDRPVS